MFKTKHFLRFPVKFNLNLKVLIFFLFFVANLVLFNLAQLVLEVSPM